MPSQTVRARCRLIPAFNVTAAVCVGMLALFAALILAQMPRDFGQWSAAAAMLGLWGATPFYWLWARSRGAIELDERGARWRTAFGPWKSARWDEITGCDARVTSTKAPWKFVVSTARGEFSWTRAFENTESLAPFTARFCPDVPADVEAWPRRFGYRGAENWMAVLGIVVSGALLVGPIVASIGASPPRDWAANWGDSIALYGWPLTLLGALLFGLMGAMPVTMSWVYLSWGLTYWRRRDEVLVASARGLSWHCGGRERLFAAWDELQSLDVEARGKPIASSFYRLQSARGEFMWSRHIGGAAQLRRTLYERAPQLQNAVNASSSELSPPPDAASESVVFSFKTRQLRALLGLGFFLGLVYCGVALLGPIPPRDGSAPMPSWAAWGFAVLLWAPTFYGALLFWRGQIRLDARGIEWIWPARKRFVAWDEIEGLSASNGFFVCVGARRYALGAGFRPAHFGQLLELVAARAVNARAGWQVDAAVKGENPGV